MIFYTWKFRHFQIHTSICLLQLFPDLVQGFPISYSALRWWDREVRSLGRGVKELHNKWFQAEGCGGKGALKTPDFMKCKLSYNGGRGGCVSIRKQVLKDIKIYCGYLKGAGRGGNIWELYRHSDF